MMYLRHGYPIAVVDMSFRHVGLLGRFFRESLKQGPVVMMYAEVRIEVISAVPSVKMMKSLNRKLLLNRLSR